MEREKYQKTSRLEAVKKLISAIPVGFVGTNLSFKSLIRGLRESRRHFLPPRKPAISIFSQLPVPEFPAGKGCRRNRSVQEPVEVKLIKQNNQQLTSLASSFKIDS